MRLIKLASTNTDGANSKKACAREHNQANTSMDDRRFARECYITFFKK